MEGSVTVVVGKVEARHDDGEDLMGLFDQRNEFEERRCLECSSGVETEQEDVRA